MKRLLLILGLILVSQVAHAEITMTDDEFDNIDTINQEIKKQDSEFRGFAGTKQKMKVIGISDVQARKYIDKIDHKKMLADKKQSKLDKKQRIEANLKSVGLTDETVKYLMTGGD